MSRIIHSEDDDDDDVGSQSSSSLSSPSKSLQQDPIPTKIPLSTSIILEKKSPLEQHQKLSNPTEGSTAGGHVSNNSLDNKIMIRFVPIGSTPSIQPRVFKISATQTVSTLNRFLCKKLKFKGVLNLYIQNSFMPLPDEQIGSLYGLFKTNNELIISYCNTIAFGWRDLVNNQNSKRMEDDKIDENSFTGLCRDVSLTTIPITTLMYIIFIIEQRKIKKRENFVEWVSLNTT